jgi:three-Cys-motif partner protein
MARKPDGPKKEKKPKWWEEPPMLDVPAIAVARRRRKPIDRALWTENKALLIERYLYYFVAVTKSGTYIDGFAGPQYPEIPDSWAAEMVLKSRPPWLRHFHLFELSRSASARLEELASREPRKLRWKRWSVRRTINVYQGDFNRRVREILDPKVIRPREPTFCLIDQRTFECEWRTIRSIASYRAEPLYKIELFYFLAQSWFDRAMAATTTEKGKRQIRRWWGGDDWQALRGATGMQRAEAFTQRFTRELHYKWAAPYAIYRRERSTQIAYWMIHATDHPAAPELMDRAYAKAVEPTREPLDQLPLGRGRHWRG